MTSVTPTRPGALVVSLDLELHWGMRDHLGRTSTSYEELARSRQVSLDLAGLFEHRSIRATWATVGFLFASTHDELASYRPEVRPAYVRSEFDPYAEPVGTDEGDDPQHLAGSLVDALAALPGQEVASHTFSHFYCLEAGQTEADLRADLAAAQAIAGSHGLRLTSLVLPRNQWNPRYAAAVLDSGFTCIRGPQPSWSHRARPAGDQGPFDGGSARRHLRGPRPTTDHGLVRGAAARRAVRRPRQCLPPALRPGSPPPRPTEAQTARRRAPRSPPGGAASCTCGGILTTSPPTRPRTSGSSSSSSTSSTSWPAPRACGR